MKYIDADKLIHDLEERIYAYSEGYADGDDYRKDAVETLLKDVRYQCSLRQEQQEVDLEKEIEEYWVATGWSKVITLGKFKVIARYFIGLGQLNSK